MNLFPRSHGPITGRASNIVQSFMTQVYGWMTCGLLLTAFVAWYATSTPAILQLILSNQIIFFGLIIVQLALVFFMSSIVNQLSGTVATSLFMLYSALTGLMLSSIFVLYTAASITSTFIVTSGMFGAMTIYGYTTQRDLSSISNILFMALIGMILASLVNLYLKSTAFMWVITYIGVVVFVALTAYDTQKLKNMGAQLSLDNENQFRQHAIIGALSLYLDFINLFLTLLRIFGNRR
ncbi:Bax inhibitor-1 family protein [Candidatus Curculioniphilus buchneri]|uniref:Bax inhibitor-1/YccA family protein n=1 Tax=Candidatus Curculioniphilus buchneri TaxID=690594 RepID=UPI00376EF297